MNLDGLFKNGDFAPPYSEDFQKFIPEGPSFRAFARLSFPFLNKSNSVISYFCLGELRHLNKDLSSLFSQPLIFITTIDSRPANARRRPR
jgi:hypothetical protein